MKALEVKIEISFGNMSILHLGGTPDTIVKYCYEYLGNGPALNDAFHTEGKMSTK